MDTVSELVLTGTFMRVASGFAKSAESLEGGSNAMIPSNTNIYIIYIKDRVCGLVVRVPGYRTEMYCASCEVRTEFIYVMYKPRIRP
jgi:hypothetical protein